MTTFDMGILSPFITRGMRFHPNSLLNEAGTFTFCAYREVHSRMWFPGKVLEVVQELDGDVQYNILCNIYTAHNVMRFDSEIRALSSREHTSLLHAKVMWEQCFNLCWNRIEARKRELKRAHGVRGHIAIHIPVEQAHWAFVNANYITYRGEHHGAEYFQYTPSNEHIDGFETRLPFRIGHCDRYILDELVRMGVAPGPLILPPAPIAVPAPLDPIPQDEGEGHANDDADSDAASDNSEGSFASDEIDLILQDGDPIWGPMEQPGSFLNPLAITY